MKMENSEKENVGFCTFNDIECLDMFELFEKMGEFWEEGKQFLFGGEILNYFQDEFSNENMIIVSSIEESVLGSSDLDELYYETLTKLNPNCQKIFWKGLVSNNHGEFIGFFEQIINNNDGKYIIKIKKLLDDHFLSRYMKSRVSDQHIYDMIVDLERKSCIVLKEDEFVILCKYLYFMLNDKASIIIGKVSFNNIQELADYLEKLEKGPFDVFEKFCKLIVSSNGEIKEDIYYWLVSKGYFEKIEEWKIR